MATSFRGTVVKVTQETPRVRKITLHVDTPVAFLPGQFVMTVFTKHHNGVPSVVKRPYSLCADPVVAD